MKLHLETLFLGLLLTGHALASHRALRFEAGPNPLFPPCKPSEVSIRPDRLNAFLQSAKDSESSALIIVENGCTVLEKYTDAKVDELLSVQSVTKSVAALAIGQLLSEGKLKTIDLPLSAIWKELLKDPSKSRITIRHLLTQTSGIPEWDKANRDPNATVLDSIWATPLLFEPGSDYSYSSMATFVLGPVIEKLSGEPADSYIKHHVLAPMGITDATWPADKASLKEADLGGGLYLTARDMLKIGATMLNGGKWQGKQVFDPKWVKLETQPSQSHFPEYGLLWWLYDPTADGKKYNVFSAVGYQGQFITVDTVDKVIVVRLHRVEDTTDLARLQKVFMNVTGEIVGLRP